MRQANHLTHAYDEDFDRRMSNPHLWIYSASMRTRMWWSPRHVNAGSGCAGPKASLVLTVPFFVRVVALLPVCDRATVRLYARQHMIS